jgi:hypothetical protein
LYEFGNPQDPFADGAGGTSANPSMQPGGRTGTGLDEFGNPQSQSIQPGAYNGEFPASANAAENEKAKKKSWWNFRRERADNGGSIRSRLGFRTNPNSQ